MKCPNPVNALPIGIAATAALLLAGWAAITPGTTEVSIRLPGQDGTPTLLKPQEAADLRGQLTPGTAVPVDLPGAWPRFRGGAFDAISAEPVSLLRDFGPAGPPKLWSLDVGEGYAGAAILGGRAYLLDYDQEQRQDVLRCLSLQDGREIWRRSYAVDITRNHGISRTIPAVTDQYGITLGPKCHVLCVDPITGEFKWGIDLVHEYGTTVPQWYAGQCPLIDGDRAIIAPGGDALMIAVDCATGQVIWKTPNPRRWEMTHSSLIPTTIAGQRMYLYCASGGVVAVSPDDGQLLWEFADWKVTMANVPSPLPIGDGRVFLTGGYGAGSLMLRIDYQDGRFIPTPLYRLKPEVFGAEQHTPILYRGHIYGIKAGGQLVCLDLDGQPLWASGIRNRFGLGPFMIADGMILVLSDAGVLTLAEATPAGFHPIGRAPVFDPAHEAWGPMALAGGRLIVRDLTRMVCLDLRKVPNDR